MIGKLSDTMVAVQADNERIAPVSSTDKRPPISPSQLEAVVVAAYLQEVRR